MASPSLGDSPSIDDEEALQLLADQTAREILQAIAKRPRSAPALAKQLDCSRATVYRRLDRLEQAGLVTTDLTVDPEGHHHRTYYNQVETLTLSVGSDGVTTDIS